jgi:hypothetical protein
MAETRVWAGVILMKDDFFSLPNLAFFRVSFPVVGTGDLHSIAP